jgi:amino-acid N-acetyltransferase
MPNHEFFPANPADAAAIKQLLLETGLPAEDFAAHLPHFWVVRQNGELAGTIGLEPYGDAGLLRSLVVAPGQRDRGLGSRLCRQMFAHARSLGVRRLYLLTTTAADFFPQLGFCRVERDSVPPKIRGTAEFASICPSTAVCMVADIG